LNHKLRSLLVILQRQADNNSVRIKIKRQSKILLPGVNSLTAALQVLFCHADNHDVRRAKESVFFSLNQFSAGSEKQTYGLYIQVMTRTKSLKET
jgi:hypothetical protein